MRTLKAFAAMALAALLLAFALQMSLAAGPMDNHGHEHGAGYVGQGAQLGLLNSSTSRYLLVYPNGTVRLIVNGTVNGTPLLKGLHKELSKRYLGVHLKSLEADVTGVVYNGGLAVTESVTGAWAGGHGGDEGDGNGFQQASVQLLSLQRSTQLNYTSNGREAVIMYRLSEEAVNQSGQAKQLNLSLRAVVSSELSPEVYIINISANASWYPALQVSGLSALEQLQVENLNGINISEFQVKLSASTLNLTLNAVVNATPAPMNTTLGLVQGLVNAILEPGYVNAKDELGVNFQQRTFSYYRFVNVSESKLRQLSELPAVLSNLPAASSLLGRLGSLGNIMGEYSEYLGMLQQALSRIGPILNVTEQVASYIHSNFQLSVPTSFSLELSLRNHTISFNYMSPLFMAKGATEPHQTLAAIDYLIGNVSEILEQNGLHGLAKVVEKTYNLSVTVVGEDGVLINGTSELTTTVGQLASLSVSVPQSSGSGSSSSATRTAEVGGAAAAAVLTAAAVVLSRRH